MAWSGARPIRLSYREGEGGIYYGWVVTLLFSLVMFGFWGSFYTFGVFFKSMAQDFGWSRAVISGAFGGNMLVQGVLGIAIGVLVDRFGPRGVMAAAGLVTALGLGLMSRVENLWQLYLYYGLLVAVGMSASWVVSVATVSRWVERRRGLALGIMLAGIGAGQMVLPPAFAGLIAVYGWRPAFLAQGVGLALLSLLTYFLLKSPPPAAIAGGGGSPSLSLGRAMRTVPFWLLAGIWFLVAIPLQFMIVHIVPFATDLGILPTAAALTLALQGLMVTLSRLGAGTLSDRLGDRRTYLGCLVCQLVAMFGLAGASRLGIFYGGGLLYGFGYGGAGVVYSKVIARVFGLQAIGAIFGVLSLAWYVGAAVGAPLGGLIYDLTASYRLAFLLGGGVMAAALGSAWVLFRIVPGYQQTVGRGPG